METLFWSPIEGYQYKGLVRAHVCSNFIKMGLAGFRYWIAICSWSNVHFISPKSRFIFNVQYSISYKIYPGDCYIEMAYLLCWIRAQTIVKLQFEEQTEVRPHLKLFQKLIIVIIVLEFQVGLDMVLVLFTTILETTMVLVLLRFKEKILGNLSLLTDLLFRWSWCRWRRSSWWWWWWWWWWRGGTSWGCSSICPCSALNAHSLHKISD